MVSRGISFMQKPTRWIGLAVALAALAAGDVPTARADFIIEYNTLASFQAALIGNSFVESNFGGLGQTSSSYSGNGFGFTVSTPANTNNYLFPGPGLTSGGLPGGTGASESTNESGVALTFNAFTGSPNAVGGYFYASDANGNMQSGVIALTVNGQSEGTVTTPSASGPAPFTGFIDTTGPITSLVADSSPGDFTYWPTADYLTVAIGSPAVSVPEPATSVLVGLGGMMALGYACRKRKRTS
jgi:hypothetical protein